MDDDKNKPWSKRKVFWIYIAIACWFSLLPLLYFGIWILGELGGQMGD